MTLVREARARGVEARALSFPSTDPATDIDAVARMERARTVLVGLHRPLVGAARFGGPLVAIAGRFEGAVCMLHDVDARDPRRILFAPGGEHEAYARDIAERLGRRGTLTLFEAPIDTDPVTALLAAATNHDLVVVGAGAAWDLSLHAFGVHVPRLIGESPRSLLVVHGGRGAG